jgi:hypothetical protein
MTDFTLSNADYNYPDELSHGEFAERNVTCRPY